MSNTSLPLTITPSRFGGAAACQRRHFAEDVVCIRPTGTRAPALAFGTVIHAGVAAWWRTRNWMLVEEAVRSAFLAEPDLVGDAKLTEALAWSMLQNYVHTASPVGGHWSSELSAEYNVAFKAIEERVVFDLGPLAALTFQLDRLAVVSSEGIEDQEHYHILVDTKTAGRLDKRWRSQWPLNLQQRIYRYATPRHYGLGKIDGHYIEGVLKASPSTVEYVALPDWDEATLDEDVSFLKRLVQRDAKLVADSMLADGTVDAALLLSALVTKTDYDPGHCHDYGRDCALLPVCSANVADRTGILLAQYEYFEPSFLE